VIATIASVLGQRIILVFNFRHSKRRR